MAGDITFSDEVFGGGVVFYNDFAKPLPPPIMKGPIKELITTKI